MFEHVNIIMSRANFIHVSQQYFTNPCVKNNEIYIFSNKIECE